MQALGRRRWAIPEGYVPMHGHGREPLITAREVLCLLNTSDDEAHVRLTVYFADGDPLGPFELLLPARRIRHVRFNDLIDPGPVPLETDYASVVESDVPIVVQHTRLDSRQAANALMTTIAFAGDE
jgi:hypothetical protein